VSITTNESDVAKKSKLIIDKQGTRAYS
jgi:hypothetical protein